MSRQVEAVRRASRVDDNQKAIVRALRAVGATVQSLASVGEGTPDLLVGYRREAFLLEVKDPTKPKSDQRLGEKQVTWHADWRGPPVKVVKTVDEALAAIRVDRFEPKKPAPENRCPEEDD